VGETGPVASTRGVAILSRLLQTRFMSTENGSPESNQPREQPAPTEPPATEPPATEQVVDPHVADTYDEVPIELPSAGISEPPPAAAPGVGGPLFAATSGSAEIEDDSRRLSTFLKVSIILLAALSVASISLLFIGDFAGKFERIFSTFVAFAIFVGLTAADTRRGQRNEWYAPVALIANSYILALLLIVIWMTPAGWGLAGEIFWKSLLVLLVTRAVVACSQLLLNMADDRPKPLGTFALITSLLATVTGILFTAPVAIEVFRVRVPELYWKFAVAALLLTALGLAITLLLRWAYTSDEREAAKRKHRAERAVAPQPYQAQAFPVGPVGVGEPVAPASPTVIVAEAPAPTQQPVHAEQQLLPWPTYPDGRPLPIGPDGQPDFSVLGRG
jgi:hypothetical protein